MEPFFLPRNNQRQSAFEKGNGAYIHSPEKKIAFHVILMFGFPWCLQGVYSLGKRVVPPKSR